MTAPRPEAVALAERGACQGYWDQSSIMVFAEAIDAALTAAENKGRSVHGLCCSECGGHMGIGYRLPCVGKKEAAARADERERACKAVCANCHDDVPLLESNKALHRVGPMEYEQCYAAAIRVMEGR